MAKHDELKKAAEAATPGEWELIPYENNEASYGSGPHGGTGYTAYEIKVGEMCLLDTINSNAATIETEMDSDCETQYAWDKTGLANLKFIAAANPAVILALLADRERLLAERERLLAALHNMVNANSNEKFLEARISAGFAINASEKP